MISPEVVSTTTTLGGMTLGGTTPGVFQEHHQGDLVTLDWDIKAAGKLTPIGAATITAVIQEFPGLADEGQRGSLDLITSKGTLTLQMTSPTLSSGVLLSPTSRNEFVAPYDISGGTGTYQDDVGTGVVEFTFTSSRTVDGVQAGGVDVTFTTMPKVTKPF
jgi:hypothetical protein